MHPAFFVIWLAALQQSIPVNCFPVHLDQSTLHRTIKGTRTRSESVDTEDYLWKVNLNGHVKKAISTNSLIVLPIRTETSDFVSILDLKSKRFLCVDVEEKWFSSMMFSRKECLFQHMRMENHVDVFYSSSNGLLLLLEGAEIPVKGYDLLKRRMVYRRKRSQQENSDAEDIKEDQDLAMQQDQERAAAISKETITSCDDPLQHEHVCVYGNDVKTLCNMIGHVPSSSGTDIKKAHKLMSRTSVGVLD
ncbi:fibroblast growth factor 23 isoform X1 [Coregonus clupeaformis]|uniref:fibroblast growth factor 23 isoform X1 n=1 Tax=Coregonus clupeaformis TaxID=59861 RepID=UPI001BE0F6AB|nr:fibroblast growth factor 23 isoform X1 [Coregonus clupeaformis]